MRETGSRGGQGRGNRSHRSRNHDMKGLVWILAAMGSMAAAGAMVPPAPQESTPEIMVRKLDKTQQLLRDL